MTQNDIEINKNKDLIFEVNENNFSEKVIESSENNIILVDFWASWCAPCKQLQPILDEIIKEANGIIVLAKVNVDENQQLAAQLKIQSIPTVIAFYNKQIVNGFQGVLPKIKIIEFIEKIYGKPLPVNKEKFYIKIKELMAKDSFNEAINSIEDFLAENSNDSKAISLYIECLSSIKKFDNVKEFINSLSEDLLSNENIKKAISKFKMLKSISKEPSINVLLDNYNKQPNSIEKLIRLCDKYFFENQYEQAFELLLNNYSKLKGNNKEIIKKKLLKYFDSLGNDHEQTKIYRRKLSSVLFS